MAACLRPRRLMIFARTARQLGRRISTVKTRPQLVLGLESSADDTCAAVVSSTRQILSSVVIKQGHIHESFGGIHPLHAQVLVLHCEVARALKTLLRRRRTKPTSASPCGEL